MVHVCYKTQKLAKMRQLITISEKVEATTKKRRFVLFCQVH